MTYEYICTACGHAWEAEQPISAAPLRQCPSCSAEAAKRQVSGGAGFILKGGGWYADLYGSAKPSKESSSDSSDSKSETKSTSEAKPSTTSETKSTTTSETKPQASAPAAKPAATGS